MAIVELSDFKLTGVRSHRRPHFRCFTPHVTIVHDGTTQELEMRFTSKTQSDRTLWEDVLKFAAVSELNPVNISVKYKPGLFKKSVSATRQYGDDLATTSVPLSELGPAAHLSFSVKRTDPTADENVAVNTSEVNEVKRHSIEPGQNVAANTRETSNALSAVRRHLASAEHKIRKALDSANPDLPDGLGYRSSDALVEVQGEKNFVDSVKDPVLAIFGFLDVAVRAVDTVSEAYAPFKAAWSILSLGFKIYKAHRERQDKVQDLLASTRNMLSFAEEADELKLHKFLHKQNDIVYRIAILLEKCATTITLYLAHGGAYSAVVYAANSTMDDNIKECVSRLDEMQKNLTTSVVLALLGSSRQATEGVEQLVSANNQTKLSEILHAVDAHFLGETPCFDDKERRAGVGKSAIAASICDSASNGNILAANFFCKRKLDGRNDSQSIIPSLVLDICASFPTSQDAVLERINGNYADARGIGLIKQVSDLLLPAFPPTIPKPTLVIVIDALDECGTRYTRGKFLSVLANSVHQLPPYVRLLITSRPDPDIIDCIKLLDKQVRRFELNTSEQKTTDDIKAVAAKSFLEMPRRPTMERWPSPNDLKQFLSLANGHFMWAETALRIIKFDPEVKLKRVLSKSQFMGGLDALYRDVVQQAVTHFFELDGESSLEAVFQSLRAVASLKDPVTIPTMIKLFPLSDNSPSYQNVFTTLAAVIHYEGGTVQVYHESFADFLRDPKLEQRSLVEKSVLDSLTPSAKTRFQSSVIGGESDQLAKKCLETVVSRVVPCIWERGSNIIDELFKYACRFWSAHLSTPGAHSREDIRNILHQFLFEKLLFWLETMSFLNDSHKASFDLKNLYHYIEKHFSDDSSLTDMAYDAYRFASFFSRTIAEHPRLISLSALPFAPTNSQFYKVYRANRTDLPRILGGFQSWWTPCLATFRGSTNDTISSVGWSHDGKRVFSINTQGKFRLWDVETGTEIIRPLALIRHYFNYPRASCSIHDDIIYIPGPDYIFRIDLSTGEQLDSWPHRTEGCGDVVVSTDGRVVTIHPYKKIQRLRICEKDSAAYLDLPMTSTGQVGLVVTCVVFSDDNTEVAAGTEEGLICLWKYNRITDYVQTSPPAAVKCLAFIDGMGVIAGVVEVDGGTLQLYPLSADREFENANTFRFPPSHSPAIFSPNTLKVATYGPGISIGIWSLDLTNSNSIHATQVGPLLVGHFHAIWSMKFSDDSTMLASGAYSDSVRVWDVTPSERFATNPETHIPHGVPYGIKFSPDGSFICSWADDGTRIWDAATRKQVVAAQSRTGGEVDWPEAPDGRDEWGCMLKSTTSSFKLSLKDGVILLGREEVWRLPMELTGEKCSFRGNFVACAVWSGEAFVVHLPKSLIAAAVPE